MMYSRKVFAVPAVFLAAALSACVSSPGTESSNSTDKVESGTLNIACSQQEDFCQKMSMEFESETGIKTTHVRLGAGEVLARLETGAGEFDVWSGGQAENHLIANDRGYIEPYISKNAANLPEQYNDKDGIWSGFYTDSIGFCSNSVELKKLGITIPESWQDLLNKKLKDRVAMPHPATAGVGYMAMFTVNGLQQGDSNKTTEYFKNLNKNVVQYSKSAATGTEMAGRGEVAVSIALDSDCMKAREAGFSDLTLSYPKEGTGYEVGAVSILKDARNQKEAKRYMDWILSEKAQNLYKDIPSFAAPTLPEINIGNNVPPQDKVNKIKWDLKLAADKRKEMVQSFETDVASSVDAK